MARPKGLPNLLTREMKERASFHGDKALKKIVTLIDSDNEDIALRAAIALLDRAYGKPAQQQIITGDAAGGPVRIGRVEIVPAVLSANGRPEVIEVTFNAVDPNDGQTVQ